MKELIKRVYENYDSVISELSHNDLLGLYEQGFELKAILSECDGNVVTYYLDREVIKRSRIGHKIGVFIKPETMDCFWQTFIQGTDLVFAKGQAKREFLSLHPYITEDVITVSEIA